MKITKRQLRRIIKEEKAKVLAEQKVRRLVRRKLMEQQGGDPVALANSTAEQLDYTVGRTGTGISAKEVANVTGLTLAYIQTERGIEGMLVSIWKPAPDGVEAWRVKPQEFVVPYFPDADQPAGDFKIHPDFSIIQSADAAIIEENMSGDPEEYISTSEAIAVAEKLLKEHQDWLEKKGRR